MASSASIYIGPFGNMASNWIFTVPLPQSVGTFSLSITPSRCPTGADHSFNQHVMIVMVGVLSTMPTCQPTSRAASHLTHHFPIST